MKSTVDTIIEQIIDATLAETSTREKHLLRTSLHNLVRIARTEQILEIKSSVRILTGTATANARARKARPDPVLHDMATAGPRQQRFEFTREEERTTATSAVRTTHPAR